ncbi:septal ring lytic transglycosylase RlpA family protein [Oscillatoria sp. FACHB-1407]|uniref:septal ring lytic transglycosylase RlpA family protein n=1 Tax=Oscillatoria sp. FACHB-1407 TaxID=2692847 RepID=UPI001683538C|nr:septal ring lytic transglycosylase RlpA family protein [Oscillatoria sp. FACHB-1407]MBD2461490.1 septal ring lytic transglycosylase RlpA family protein [Oscillatoria sp. FACHB-1407]
MNHKLWSGLTTAALILTTVGNAASSYAGQPTASDDLSDTNVSSELDDSEPTTFSLAVPSPAASPEPASAEDSASNPVSPETQSSDVATTLPTTTPDSGSSNEVAKVGEYQSQEDSEPEAIAEIQPHLMSGRQAATLYVQSIPVLTFLGSAAPSTSVPDSAETALANSNATGSEIKVGTTQADETAELLAVQPLEAAPAPVQDENDPTWRASALAAQINQLYLNNIDASAITVRWNGDRERYVIEVNGEELVEMNPNTILPDSTDDPAEDALQATNRLRRLLGDAEPLREIAGRPEPTRASQLSFSTTRQFTGVASWYGPGFHGNRSASGEVFNQNALTAAHRSLPFGTQVRVTNLHTGQSVIVRITDRGPFSRGRIIDLSAGAARVIGLIRSGVAPVRLDVLRTVTASN